MRSDIAFDTILPRVKDTFDQEPSAVALAKRLGAVTIIRDVHGKVRLLLEPLPAEQLDPTDAELHAVTLHLQTALGQYHGGDAWIAGSSPRDGMKALVLTIQEERLPAFWDEISAMPRWYVLERRVSKQSWTGPASATDLPWVTDLVDSGHKPAVIAFFSFKGGVGRTTSVVATALVLARNGHRVTVVDLDLEAPGLASLFLPDGSESPGVLDYLIEKPVQGSDWRVRPHLLSISEPALVSDDGQVLRFLPAGNVDDTYLEKLARVDLQHMTDEGIAATLREMLREVEAANRPQDFLLLDARAGFHEIGGLTLASLAHAAVVFGTDSRQSWAGLQYVLRRAARPAQEDNLPLVLVHAMAPSLTDPMRDLSLRTYRERAYDAFTQNYYREDDLVPNPNDDQAPFMPVTIEWQHELRGDVALFRRDGGAEERARLDALVHHLAAGPHVQLAHRICALFGRSLERNAAG